MCGGRPGQRSVFTLTALYTRALAFTFRSLARLGLGRTREPGHSVVTWERQRRSRLAIEPGGVWVRVPIKTVCLSDLGAPVCTHARAGRGTRARPRKMLARSSVQSDISGGLAQLGWRYVHPRPPLRLTARRRKRSWRSQEGRPVVINTLCTKKKNLDPPPH